jgi:hypothetical protein
LLFGSVILCKPMGEHIAGSESDFLRADRDDRCAICGIGTGRHHERPESQYREDPSK